MATKKTALITGGAKGIGLAVSKELIAGGYSVIVTGRDEKALRDAEKLLGVVGIACDVRQPNDVRALMAKVKQSAGTLDVLFNNAGVAHPLKNVEDISLDEWKLVMQTNLDGTFLVTQAALPLMSKGGTIVMNISKAAVNVFPGFAGYCASKAGALAFTNVLREELRARGVRVTALLPGAIDTAIWDQFWAEAPREKMVAPESVARMVAEVVRLPEEATVEQLIIGPAVGTL